MCIRDSVTISHMRSREYRATFLMFLEIAAVAVLLLVFFKIFARTFHDNAVIFITEHFDCFNKKAPSKATIAACLTAVSYTHLDVYKRQSVPRVKTELIWYTH